MENTKAKKVLMGVVVALVIVCLAIVIWKYIENKNAVALYKESMKKSEESIAKVNAEVEKVQNSMKELKEKLEKKESEEKNATETATEQLVVDQINEVYNKMAAAKKDCADGFGYTDSTGTYAYLRVALPKVNIDTAAVKSLNADILQLYNSVRKAKYVSEAKGGDSVEISYDNSKIAQKDLLFIKVNISHLGCYTSTVEEKSYVYDMQNDKVLSNEEVLKKYDKTNEKLVEAMFNELKTRTSETLGDDVKAGIEKYINSKNYTIADLGQNTIVIDANNYLHNFKFSI